MFASGLGVFECGQVAYPPNMRRSVLVIPCSELVNRFHKAQVREMVEEKKTEFYRLHSLLRAERILDCV